MSLAGGREIDSSTPTCSCCAPTRNQTPPRALSACGFSSSSSPSRLAEEPPRLLLAAGGSGELDVVDADEHGDEDTPRVTPGGLWRVGTLGRTLPAS